MSESYESKTYFAMSLDPVHIGTGGYRLGRVDNTIVREAGTNLPKIPGTSIEGNARTYVYYAEQENRDLNEACAVGKNLKDNKDPCGKCPVCVTFGFTKKDKSLHGMAQFNDARILFFPVHSMIGPVWVTCPSILKEIFEKKENIPVLVNKELRKEEIIVSSQIKENHNIQKLNLGFLYLNMKYEQNFVDDIEILPTKFKDILERLVVVNNDIFEKIVNSNLEVRTSVSIDPRTGAAEEGALFTYEAIPRATVFWFDLVANDPKKFNVDPSSEINSPQRVIKEVEKSFKYFENLGIGGMQTKGFGRLRILNGGSDGSN